MIEKHLNELTQLLKEEILFNHFDTGKLHKSVKFEMVGGKLVLSAEEYINYLEKDDFIDNFFKRTDVLELVSLIITENLTKKINI